MPKGQDGETRKHVQTRYGKVEEREKVKDEHGRWVYGSTKPKKKKKEKQYQTKFNFDTLEDELVEVEEEIEEQEEDSDNV